VLAGLLVFAIPLACAEDPDKAREASAGPCRIAIDVGHGGRDPGARSARGSSEYEFNRRLAADLVAALEDDGSCSPLLVKPVGELAGREGLHARTRLANEAGVDLFLSIHHDSVQPHLLEPWTWNGREERRSRGIQGFSLFVSDASPAPEASLRFATALADELLASGLRPSLHHAADIEGERRRLLDLERGIYAADYWVIRDAQMPSVLLEAGVITDPDEEAWLASADGRAVLDAAAARAVRGYLEAMR